MKQAVAALVLIAAILSACGGATESDPPSASMSWSPPSSTHLASSFHVHAARLSTGTTLAIRQTVQGTDDVVTLTVAQKDGSAPRDYEVLRASNSNCITQPLYCDWDGAQVRADEVGGAYVAWLERTDTAPYQRLHLAYFKDSVGLTNRWTVVTEANKAVRTYDLAVRPNGTGILAWVESVPDSSITKALGPSEIYAIDLAASGPSSAPAKLSQTIPIEQSGIVGVYAAVSTNGHSLVLWTYMANTFSNDELWASNSTPNKSWSTATLLSFPGATVSPRSNLSSISAAINDSGNGVAAWSVKSSNPDVLRVDCNHLSTGTSWSGPVILADNAQNPATGVTPSNIAYVSFLDRTQTADIQNSIRVARFESGRSEGVLDVTPRLTQPYVVGPAALGVLADGTAVFSWIESPRGSPVGSYVKRRVLDPPLVWSQSEQISAPNALMAQNLSVSALANLQATIFWHQEGEIWFTSSSSN